MLRSNTTSCSYDRYLLYTGKLANAPQAITVIETLMSRQLGQPGREIVVMVAEGLATPLS